MRFKTKFDRWIVIVLVLTAALTCILLPVVRVLVPGSQPIPLPAVFVPVVIWLIVLPNTLPQYYELRSDGLFIRQGWRKSLVPYASIAEAQAMADTRSAPVFSADRIHIVTETGKRFIIAVAEEERFLDELAKRCPQLNQKPSGLGMPLSTPSDI